MQVFFELDYWFIIKEYNSVKTRWKRYIVQSMCGKSTELPSVLLSPNLHMFKQYESSNFALFLTARWRNCYWQSLYVRLIFLVYI